MQENEQATTAPINKDNLKQNESTELVKTFNFEQKSTILPTETSIVQEKQHTNKTHRETATKSQNLLRQATTNTQKKIFLEDAVIAKGLYQNNLDDYDQIEEVDSFDDQDSERDEKKLQKIYSFMVAIVFILIFSIGTILSIVLPKVYN
jgi:hypothetical protein